VNSSLGERRGIHRIPGDHARACWSEVCQHADEALDNRVHGGIVVSLVWAISNTTPEGKAIGSKVLGQVGDVRIILFVLFVTTAAVGSRFGGGGCGRVVIKVAGIVIGFNLAREVS
jgi:hypothetical protein